MMYGEGELSRLTVLGGLGTFLLVGTLVECTVLPAVLGALSSLRLIGP